MNPANKEFRLGNYKAGRITKHHGHNLGQATVTPENGGAKLQIYCYMMEQPYMNEGEIVIDGSNTVLDRPRPPLDTKVLYLIDDDGCVRHWTKLSEVQKLIWRQAGGK